MADLTGIEPAVFSVTGRHVNRYTTGPLDSALLLSMNKSLIASKKYNFFSQILFKNKLFNNFELLIQSNSWRDYRLDRFLELVYQREYDRSFCISKRRHLQQ